MKLDFKKIFYFILNIFLKLLTILLPIVLLVAGSIFINMEILHYFQREWDIFEVKAEPLNIVIGITLFILALVSIWLTVKTKSIYYFAIFSLIVNGVFIFGAIAFISTPTLDLFVGNILFKKGFCIFLDKAVENYPNPWAKETESQFCALASKMFEFDYPDKYSN